MARKPPDRVAVAHQMCARIGADWAPSPGHGATWSERVAGFAAVGDLMRGARGWVDYLQVRPSGNFGNNYIQLLHALAVAEAAGVRRVYHPFGWFSGGRPDRWLSLQKRRRPPEKMAGLAGAYFITSNIRTLEEARPETFLRLSDDFLKPRLSVGETPVAPVILNIRGGADIFENDNPNGRYGQPPLSFYQLALANIFARHGPQQVVVVHQDERNPMLGALLDWLSAEGVRASRASGGPEADARMILGAKHLVMGKTTFTAALAMMSNRLESLTVFRDPPLRELLERRAPLLYRVDDAGGEYFMASRWRNSERQRRMMLTYPADALELTEVAKPVDIAPWRREGARLRRWGRRRRLMARLRLGRP